MTENELREIEWNRTAKILACEIDGCPLNSVGWIEENDEDDPNNGRIIYLCHKHHGQILKPQPDSPLSAATTK